MMNPACGEVNPRQCGLEPGAGRSLYSRAMPSISITRAHTLSKKKARDAAERIARDLEQRFDLAYAWEGDHLVFERPGVTGRIEVTKDSVTLDVRLGLLLTPLRHSIEREIHVQLDKLFGKPRGG